MNKIDAAIQQISGLDYKLMERAQDKLNNLTKPLGSLGRLEELAKAVVGITAKECPVLKNKVIFTLAADHGITEDGVSAFPKEVTCQMVYNFIKCGAGINVLARHAGARVVIVDMGVACDLDPSLGPSFKGIGRPILSGLKDGKVYPLGLGPHQGLIIKKVNYGTKNMSKGPAMSGEEAVKSIENGMEVFEEEFKKGIDIIGTGDMGIGNTTASSAITSVITGKAVSDVTGKGTGIDDKSLANKIKAIEKSIAINRPQPQDALDVLSKIGGFEIGGLCGVILAAASKRVPVVIDGFISGAAALIAYKLAPQVKDYLIAAHCSVEKGHKAILDYIGLKPILDLNLRLGEGTGAALGIGIVEAGIKILNEMATFQSASVSKED